MFCLFHQNIFHGAKYFLCCRGRSAECAEAGQADTVTTGASSVPPAGLSSGGEDPLTSHVQSSEQNYCGLNSKNNSFWAFETIKDSIKLYHTSFSQ